MTRSIWELHKVECGRKIYHKFLEVWCGGKRLSREKLFYSHNLNGCCSVKVPYTRIAFC